MDAKKAAATKKAMETRKTTYCKDLAKEVTAYAVLNGPARELCEQGALSQDDFHALSKFAMDRLAEVFFLLFDSDLDALDDLLVVARYLTEGLEDPSLDMLKENLAKGHEANNS